MFIQHCRKLFKSVQNVKVSVATPLLSHCGHFKPTYFSTSSSFNTNYYSALGISASATQNDIKAAYYKLSMIYHPDKNQGSASAAKKFREISQAYEVLSNYRLRKLYDKGIVHTAGPEYARPEDLRHEQADDDPETKFYKSRFTKSKVTATRGQTPIYNFDEWAQAHYGKSFNRRKDAKARYDRKITREREFSLKMQKEKVIVFALVFFFMMYFFIDERSYDTPQEVKKDDKE